MATLAAFFREVRASVRINQFVDPDCVADLFPGSLRDGIEFGSTLEALALEYLRRPFDLLWERQLPEVAVHGDYKALRSGQDMFLVDDDGTAYRGQTPFVKVEDDLPPVDELRDDLDQKVERRVKRRMCGQQRIHYEEEVDGRVRADITEVESLGEAARIVRGDQRKNNDHGSDREDGGSDGEQATLAGY